MAESPGVSCIPVAWPAPANVRAVTTRRVGGFSTDAHASFNLALHVDDDSAAVAANRDKLARYIDVGLDGGIHSGPDAGVQVQWLQQVHGNRIITAGADELTVPGEVPTAEKAPTADGALCSAPGRACAVLTADCLPVLLCDTRGTVVSALHVGWRGLVAGVIEAGISAIHDQVGVATTSLIAWLGPCIGRAHFEVGPEVRSQCLESIPGGRRGPVKKLFTTSPLRKRRFLADLQGLASERLVAAGVQQLFFERRCTFADADRFYSYRREHRTGRMASLIYLV